MEFLNIYMCMFDYMCVALACLSYGHLILMCVCVCVYVHVFVCFVIICFMVFFTALHVMQTRCQDPSGPIRGPAVF